MNKLDSVSNNTAKAWKWVQEYEFEHEVYPPAMISCSIKDPRYVRTAVFLLEIAAQNITDMKKLSRHIHDVIGVPDVTVRTSSSRIPNTRPLSPDELNLIS